MNISLIGNQKPMTTQAGAAEPLSVADGATRREKTPQEVPNLTVSEAPAQSGVAGVSPAALEKEIRRDDDLGKLVDKALDGVVPKAVPAKVAEMLAKSQYETAEQLRAQLTAGLPPGEKGLVRDELARVTVRA